ncbi:hypothetical protein B4U79_04552, partial [Dinothrombium tinctorium]
CRRGEVFTNCGTACPLTCANLNNPPRACTAQCVVGCVCARGLYRDHRGNCVARSLCHRRG